MKRLLFAVIVGLGASSEAVGQSIQCLMPIPSFSIEADSMLPTLPRSAVVTVQCWPHAIPYSGIPVAMVHLSALHPQVIRGDIVVFLSPRDLNQAYTKRVVGVPGDRIQYREGRLILNGSQMLRTATGDFLSYRDGLAIPFKRYTETLPSGRSYDIIEEADSGVLDNTGEYKVPDNHLFVLGDNRDNSLDSRLLNAIGFIPASRLIGTLIHVVHSVQ